MSRPIMIMVFSGMTLPSSGHQARVVALSYTTERKGVSS
jgi:hypothetical protein